MYISPKVWQVFSEISTTYIITVWQPIFFSFNRLIFLIPF